MGYLAAAPPGWVPQVHGCGAIRAGLNADFAVIDADLSHIPAGEIGTAAAIATWILGRLVYRRS